MNRQPYGVPPKWWAPKLSPKFVRWTRGYRLRQLRNGQRIRKIDVVGEEHLRTALDAGKGVMITPNHSAHYDSAALYIAADRIDTPLFFMTAWQVFAMSRGYERWMMQRLGCFTIDRESNDRQAFKQGISVLQNEPQPLVIFPEGDIYHVTDRVTPFREGAAAIALQAAKRADREIVVVPCGIKFFYADDPTPGLVKLLGRLEERLFLRPLPEVAIADRIHRIAEASLALKEIDYLGRTAAGRVRDRIEALTESILLQIEGRYEIDNRQDTVPLRAKSLRQEIIQQAEQKRERLAEGKLEEVGERSFSTLEADMDDVFLVMQLYSYPGDYLIEGEPSIERLAETLDKFEEDILGQDLPSLRGTRDIEVRFGEPIPVSSERKGRDAVTVLTETMCGAVQTLVNDINRDRQVN